MGEKAYFLKKTDVFNYIILKTSVSEMQKIV